MSEKEKIADNCPKLLINKSNGNYSKDGLCSKCRAYTVCVERFRKWKDGY